MSFTPHNIGAMEVRNNTTQTQIPASDEFVKLDGSIWEVIKTDNMDFNDDEIVVKNYGDYMITVSLSANVESSDVDFEFIIANNGEVIAHSRMTTHFSSVETQHIGLNSLATFERNDSIALKVKNNTDTTNVTVEDAVLRAVRV